ncbi:Putative acetolactate synthase large subunit IlvX [Pigmentiphaga humi]|uniref:Acetolactate synthase large subunit IlvX n=1 Tax=Pigmentiphaga humi TaxID=2478468 RepID=A0A3P4B6M6_9BURK|nr:acetolactate synthase large subunit [Pigmentiphaga humi]VCU71943.1 Putative acetolactate synthase large subunit IlvX [Pigmentiphaga humi]
MNGAESLVRTLLASNIDVCFANPGTSEMHFVAALDRVPGMRCVLGLFEGVVTGAADGYGRMADKPAATLLHLGPGLANGIANLHNARKARTPIVNIVGEHASDHLQYESPLRSDVPATAALISDWYRVGAGARIPHDAAEAVTAARSRDGQIATLILPADTAWGPGETPQVASAPPPLVQALPETMARVVQAVKAGKRCGLLVTGRALEEAGLAVLARLQDSGIQLLAQQANRRFARGRGRLVVPRVPFSIDQAVQQLAGLEMLVLAGSHPPAAFFGYPNKPRLQTPPGCEILPLVEPGGDTLHALAWLADELGCPARPAAIPQAAAPTLPATDRLDADTIMQAMAALLPENAILCDESVSSGRSLFKFTDGAAPHDYLQITGGSIGCGLPLATGASVACPDRKVVCFEGDGSGMYTLQALWTQARENLDVLTIILANRSYRILQGELKGVGIDSPGEQARRMLDLSGPSLDWMALARGQGVEAVAVDTVGGFARAFKAACARKGPFLIEARIP